jgi:hypothetical protein
VKGRSVQDRKLPIEQMDKLSAIFNIRGHTANPLVTIESTENFRRTIRQRDLIVSCRGEHGRDSRTYFAGADNDNVLHQPLQMQVSHLAGSTRAILLTEITAATAKHPLFSRLLKKSIHDGLEV